MHLPVGTILRGGRYEILRYISSGGFGCTYEARDTAFRNKVKTVAIKEFFVKDFCNRDTVTGNVVVATQSKKELIDKLRSKFMDEAEALYEFQHPNIVRVTDKFEENDTAYYVMDFIDGRSLNAIVEEKGCLSDPEAVGYIRQIADALKYVHDNNCLHLDVKPGNIMIDSHGKAVLIDFGVSKQYDEVKGENTSTLMGYTPGYAPLEQSGNGVVKFSPATDIYSLGATMFKILTGITPPIASEVNENGLPAFPDGTSDPVRRAIEASMQPRRKDRPQNIDEFLVLLDGDEVELIATDNDVAEMEGCCAMPEDNGSGAVVLPLPDNVYIDDDVHVEEVVPVRPRKNRKTVFLLLFVLVAVSAVLVINHLGSNGASSEVALSDEPKVFVSGNMDQEEHQPDSVDMHDDVEDINEIESVVSVEAITASEAFDKGNAEYDKGNFEEAVKWFRKSADQGDADAQYNLGLYYYNGEGVDQSYEEAVKWFRKSADQGNADAQFVLGVCYYNGEGVDQSYEEAVKWFRKSADQGYAKAQFNLGVCYYNGEGVDQSYEEAVKWFRKAADQGDADAQFNLGNRYYNGEGVDQSYEEAAKWFRKAADQGNVKARYNLGNSYYNGRGVPKSYEEAVKWWRLAADQGHAEAQFNLGLCYGIGEGVDQSYEEAVKWWRKAADQGYAEAQFNLGVCYYDGEGVDQSYEEAVKWYRKAADQGHAGAQCNLGNCYDKGEGVDQSYEEAAKWWRKAADQGLAGAQYYLGVCYYNGEGVDQSYEEAAEWFRKAADQGDADAQFNLGNSYYNGRGVPKSYEEAVKWYRKAADQGHAEAVKWSVAAQNAKVTGKVTDTNGEAVIGASVIVIGTNLGASTDIEGNFTIENVPSCATIIRVSYVGMAAQEVRIVRGKAMKVVLIED